MQPNPRSLRESASWRPSLRLAGSG
jgi:hypothetical protein